jgi:hypothetical protein
VNLAEHEMDDNMMREIAALIAALTRMQERLCDCTECMTAKGDPPTTSGVGARGVNPTIQVCEGKNST